MTSNLPIKHHTTAGCVLLDNQSIDANALLIYREWESAPQGAYILPKGHVEIGETPEIAAIRETVEETGYQNIRIIKPLITNEVKYEKDGFWNVKEIQWFLAVLIDITQQTIELTDTEKTSQEFSVDWYPSDKAIELVNSSPLDADKPAINLVKEALS